MRDSDKSLVESLSAEGRLTEAAKLLASAGEHSEAASLLERACDFEAAAGQALAAGDPASAMRLIVLSGDAAACREVSTAVLGALDDEQVRKVAADLAGRGYHRYAGELLRRIDEAAAAGHFERAGLVADAARCHDEAGNPAQAARLLEAALRGDQHEDSDALRLSLGQLYARHGKHDAAVRVLQRIEDSSEHRRAALVSLLRALEALGLRQAIRDLEPELARRGLDPDAHEAPSQATATATLYGRYEVVREVATTPHARLVEATDMLSGERVAVKIFASHGSGTGRDALSRFVREARALTQLRHANVVPLRDFLPEGPAMVLEWMAGGSLQDLLSRETLSPARAAEIARALLDALAQAHRLGILHRDIKPSNLLFDGGGTARLSDFGAAHLAESDVTVTVGEIGTLAYMAPEQRDGRAATVQSDIYAVGALMFEMLTGASPAGDPRGASAHPDLDGSHDALIGKLLAADPAARFGAALEAQRAVEAVTWPTRIVERAPRHRSDAPQAEQAPQGARVTQPHRAGDGHDSWLERDIHVLPLDDASLKRASAFARAGHPALPTVLRADAEAAQIWIEVARGRPLSQGLALDNGNLERLRSALAALHRAGGAHGRVDADHVSIHAGAAYLALPQVVADDAQPEADTRALERLPRR